MTKEEFIKKWATDLLERVGLTQALNQQLNMEFRKDLDEVIDHENERFTKGKS